MFLSRKRHPDLIATSLYELWHIGPNQAKATMEGTTQRGMQSKIMPLIRRYLSNYMYYIKRLQGRIATGTLFADMKSLHRNTCWKVYSYKYGFTDCSPQINTKGESLGKNIDYLMHDFGAPEHLAFDGFSSQVVKNTRFTRTCTSTS